MYYAQTIQILTRYFTALLRKTQNKLCTPVQKITVSFYGISKKWYLYLYTDHFDHSHISCKCRARLCSINTQQKKIESLLLKAETRIVFPKVEIFILIAKKTQKTKKSSVPEEV